MAGAIFLPIPVQGLEDRPTDSYHDGKAQGTPAQSLEGGLLGRPLARTHFPLIMASMKLFTTGVTLSDSIHSGPNSSGCST